MKIQKFISASTLSLLLAAAALSPANALIIDLTIHGSDAIFLAGRTDITIPDADQPWNTGSHLIRHGGPTPEEIKETVPPYITVAGGDVIRVADPAVGGISFYNGFGAPFFGPDGNGVSGSNLSGLDGISGYIGPQGPLAGVFLDDSIPDSGPAPMTLDFTPGGIGTDFLTLEPELGQVFYIGDGLNAANMFQEFTAPVGATRLFLGIPDGFGFVGLPGAYDDNDGSYQVRIGVNESPGDPIPEPGTIFTLSLGVIAFGLMLHRRRHHRE